MQKQKLIVGLVIAGVAVVGITLLWRLTPLSQLLRPEHIAQQLDALDRFGWLPFLFVGAYVAGGLIMFPVTVMSAATAIVFPPYKAVAVSFSGILISAALLHWLGARFIGERAKKAMGPTIKRLDEALTDRGILTIAAIRMIPLAPFTLVNLAAGAMGVGFRDYILGTMLGLLPGISVVCIFGSQVRSFWRHPSSSGVMLIAAIGIAWIVLSIGLQRWVSRRVSRRTKPTAEPG